MRQNPQIKDVGTYTVTIDNVRQTNTGWAIEFTDGFFRHIAFDAALFVKALGFEPKSDREAADILDAAAQSGSLKGRNIKAIVADRQIRSGSTVRWVHWATA